ncbi:MAG: YbfB/YjiJ family MFS transporter [Collimonas pratensis]|uniref:YbfB/YjiJ family MFS transporter n=1 Tax=Collimonas pratensis TaxID=279113 RepID=UPI003C72B9BE
MQPTSGKFASDHPFFTAIALSLGPAIALGVSRFSYGLLMLPMRSDLGWSYLLAGTMNTANAFGYFLGALATPMLIRRWGARCLLISGALLTGIFTLLSGFVTEADVLLFQRMLVGMSSAFVFIAGGVLAARLGALRGKQMGLLLGLYYGGSGLGIVLSALLVPLALAAAQAHASAHGWQWAWLTLGTICLLAALVMGVVVSNLPEAPLQDRGHAPARARSLLCGLSSYFMFGVGYIGYMTFVVSLLKQQGMHDATITVFYSVLGLAVIISGMLWARMLDRFKGGESMAILNGLLAVATLLPVLGKQLPLVFISGILFGAVFMSVVTSTTVLVRHNLPAAAWSSAISMFTTVFALGQIVGPTIVGWIADGAGGLKRGLVFSAVALLIAALLARGQRQQDTTEDRNPLLRT